MNNETMRKIVIYGVPEETERKLRVMAATEGKTFQDKVRELLKVATAQCSITPLNTGGDNGNRQTT